MGFGNICARLIYGINITDIVKEKFGDVNEWYNENSIDDTKEVYTAFAMGLSWREYTNRRQPGKIELFNMGDDHTDICIIGECVAIGGGIWDDGGSYTYLDLEKKTVDEKLYTQAFSLGLDLGDLKPSYGLYISHGQLKY